MPRPRPHTLTNPHPDHLPRVGRFVRGMTSIRPSRPVYGTTVRCSCGAHTRINEPKSGKGNTRARQWYAAHLAEVLSEYGRLLTTPGRDFEKSVDAERAARLALPGQYVYWKARGDDSPPPENHWCDHCAGWFGVPHNDHKPGFMCRSAGRRQCACIDCVVFEAMPRAVG